MKLSLPPETYALVAVATADVVITLTTAGFEGLAHVLRSKIACTTLVLIVIRCVLSVLTARVAQASSAAMYTKNKINNSSKYQLSQIEQKPFFFNSFLSCATVLSNASKCQLSALSTKNESVAHIPCFLHLDDK